jgi:2'-hydroxyisoflavone reductase
MRILLLGGTRFLGRHLVDAALACGHELTLFNRGVTNPGLFPELEQIHGDRATDLDRLAGRDWDAVVDTCGYLPREVRLSAETLASHLGRYVFVSTISVYADGQTGPLDEDAQLARLEDEGIEEVTPTTYGGLKVLCEQAVARVYADRALILRPGLIVGPHDLSDRFTYWPWRIAQGGEVLAPGDPEQGVQVIDARDLADWTIRLVEEAGSGILHAVGPERPWSMTEVLAACLAAGDAAASLSWVDEDFLLGAGLKPWTELPLWVPAAEAGSLLVDIHRALAAGLIFRPLQDTVRDTLAWARTRPPEHALRAGITREREAQVLRDWHAR